MIRAETGRVRRDEDVRERPERAVGRQGFVDGEGVADVSRHKAFREAARSVARLYDIAAAPKNREVMTFTSPKTGQPVLRAFQIPKTHADLLKIVGAGGVRFAPRAQVEYNNSNYLLLGYILEKIYEKPYGDIVRQQIIDKLEEAEPK